MPKHADPQTQGFGQRLAQLRKATGHTQRQLADEISASKRQIACYEGESDQPPASLLIALAQTLNVTTDALLGIGTKRKATASTISTQLERRLKLIERMPAKPKQQLPGLIDTFIAADSRQQATHKPTTRKPRTWRGLWCSRFFACGGICCAGAALLIATYGLAVNNFLNHCLLHPRHQ